MTDYEMLWKTITGLVTNLQNSGEYIPVKIIEDLRSARTMIEVFKADRSYTENLFRIEEYLGSVESFIISVAEKKFGAKCADEWMKKIEEARSRRRESKIESPQRFVSNIPRDKDKDWIRIQVSKDIPLETIKKTARKEELGYVIQEDGYVIIFGKKDKVRGLVRKMKTLHKKIRSHNCKSNPDMINTLNFKPLNLES